MQRAHEMRCPASTMEHHQFTSIHQFKKSSHREPSWAIMGHHGPSWAIMGYNVLRWFTDVYRRFGFLCPSVPENWSNTGDHWGQPCKSASRQTPQTQKSIWKANRFCKQNVISCRRSFHVHSHAICICLTLNILTLYV